MIIIGNNTFEQFRAELQAKYEDEQRAYDAGLIVAHCWCCDVEPPYNQAALPELELRKLYDALRELEVEVARWDAERAEKEFIRCTSFPLSSYSPGGRTVAVLTRRQKATFLAQVTPRVGNGGG